MKTDFISIVEAAYNIEQSEDAWLAGIVSAARSAIDRGGLGTVAYCYDASDPARFRRNAGAQEGVSDALLSHFAQSFSQLDAGYIRRSFGSLSCATISEVLNGNYSTFVDLFADEFGVRDMLTINALNPDGLGCVVSAFLAKETKLGDRRRETLSKLACHIAAAYRLRRRLAQSAAESTEVPEVASPAAEAILDHDGKIHHAEGDASARPALALLTKSALAIAKARSSLRKVEPEKAIDEWHGLVAARWTLLDVFETDGREYLVARRNQPRTPGPPSLTEREQQVVAFAAMGHHNKLIAYNLGVSHSTVRVLVARAATRLGASSRDDLIDRYRRAVEESMPHSEGAAIPATAR